MTWYNILINNLTAWVGSIVFISLYAIASWVWEINKFNRIITSLKDINARLDTIENHIEKNKEHTK